MTTAFVFDNETVLCRHTPEGWWPLQLSLPQMTVPDFTNHSSENATGLGVAATDTTVAYQLGCVQLAASLTPSDWEHEELADALENTVENEGMPATMALTHCYAINNNIILPKITTLAVTDDLVAGSLVTDGLLTPDLVSFISYRQLLTLLPVALAAQLSQAIQLLRWQADTQFCSRCSAPVTSAEFGERAMVCAVCRLRQYPRVQPCVITAITRPNPITGEMQILLAHHHRYGRQTPPLQYGLIAGFVEVGESLEHAVVREVAEEVNISLTDIRYVSSQPWPFPSNLMLGFQATYAGGEIVLQEDELSHAAFFDISNLPKIPFKGSIAYDLIAQIVHEQGMSL